MKRLILVVTMMTSAVYADEFCGKSVTIFGCKTNSGKTIRVCEAGADKAVYLFGKKQSPEKTITRQVDDLVVDLWDGNGSTAKQSVTFKENAHRYRVFSSYQRQIDGKATRRADVDFDTVAKGGVDVFKGEKKLATVPCKADTIKDRIETYYAKSTHLVFKCETTRHKQISIEKTASNYIYRYGKAGETPELMLTLAHDAVIKTPWNGIGYTITESMGFTSGGNMYSVYVSLERRSGGEESGGVLVEMAGKDAIDISCANGTLQSSLAQEIE